jgi:ElaB/YqjD/DUF883 family membrane-anchored ribosome-binding protein
MEPRTGDPVQGRRSGNGSAQEGGQGAAQLPPQIAELRERAEQVVDRAAQLVRQRPVASLLVAVAAGYVIGRLLRA